MLRIARSYRVHLRAYFLIIRGIWLQGRFDTTPIRIEIEASSSEKEILNTCGVVPEGTTLKQEAHTF